MLRLMTQLARNKLPHGFFAALRAADLDIELFAEPSQNFFARPSKVQADARLE